MGREEDIARIRSLHGLITAAESRNDEAEAATLRTEAHALAGRYVCTPTRPHSMNIDPGGRSVHPGGPDGQRCSSCGAPWVGLVPVDRGGG